MKNYFNSEEQKEHLVILSASARIQTFLENRNLLPNEKRELKKVVTAIQEFTNSVIGRMGIGYAKSLSNKAKATDLVLKSKYAPKEKAELVEIIDNDVLQQIIADNYDFNCTVCSLEDYKSCGIYQIKSYLGTKAVNNGDGCPFKIPNTKGLTAEVDFNEKLEF